MAAPNLKEIEHGIYELEHEESSKNGYALLAALYTCRNEMMGQPARQSLSACSETAHATPLEQYGDSDFLRAVSGVDPTEAWAVMDELMDTLMAVNRRAYDSVMRKLQNI